MEDLLQRNYKKINFGTGKKQNSKPTIRGEVVKHRQNVIEILLNSNATPIRCKNDLGYSCIFCNDHYPSPSGLKKHTLMGHDEDAVLKVVKDIRMYTVKLDITDLQCTICEADLDDIHGLVEHLVCDHGRVLHPEVSNHIVPFKFNEQDLKCAMCENKFAKFRNLIEHMNTHFRNYVCDVCGAGFVNRDILRSHLKIHRTGTFNCELCPKSFNTLVKKRSHVTAVHQKGCMTRKCGYCNELFDDYNKKNAHLTKFHGVDVAAVKCKLCDETFSNQTAVRVHVRKIHLLERKHECGVCEKKFFHKKDMTKHMVSHTKERKY